SRPVRRFSQDEVSWSRQSVGRSTWSIWSRHSGSSRERSHAWTHTHFISGTTSQLPFWRVPPQGPFRRFFGQRIGHVSPVECRMHCPHIRQSHAVSFVHRSTASSARWNPLAAGAVCAGRRSSLALVIAIVPRPPIPRVAKPQGPPCGG